LSIEPKTSDSEMKSNPFNNSNLVEDESMKRSSTN